MKALATCLALLLLAAIARAGDCGPPEAWTGIPTEGAPSPRRLHTAVWTGRELIVWGGLDHPDATFGSALDTGGRYDPQTRQWSATSTLNAPAPRYLHAAVWTGTRMLVWGGATTTASGSPYLNDGGSYDPSTDTWEPIAMQGAPQARSSFAYAWTGSELVVAGGSGLDGDGCAVSLDGGGRYDPVTDGWTVFDGGPRAGDLARGGVWIGDRLFVTGGLRWERMDGSCTTVPIIPGWRAPSSPCR